MVLPYVLAPNAERLEIRRSRYDIAAVLLRNGDISAPRISKTNDAIVWGFDGKLKSIAGPADWVHSIDSVGSVGGPTALISVSKGRYASAGLRRINGQDTEVSDVIEVPSGVARAFNPAIPAGRYKVVDRDGSSAAMKNINPAQYTLTNVSEIGGAVYYRNDPNNPGGLEGLNRVNLELDGTPTQTRPGTNVVNPEQLFDGNPNTYMFAGSASWQGIRVNFKVKSVPGSPPAPAPQAGDLSLRVEALQFRVGAVRYSYDGASTNALFWLNFYSGKEPNGTKYDLASSKNVRDAETLTVHTGTTWANSAGAPITYYWREAVTIGSFRLDDGSGSRASVYEMIPIVANVNSRIVLSNGVIPEIGATLNVSDAVAKTFSPTIKPGAYTVLKNDGIGPWRLSAPLKLISAIGGALVWALYVGDSSYDENETDTIVFEVGTIYELKVNSPEKITAAEYRITFPGSDDEVFPATSVGTNFAQNWRPSIAQMTNAGGAAGSITVTAGTWTKSYPARLQYTQKGAIGLEAGGSYKTGSTFEIDVTSDPLRTYTETRIEVFNAAGVSVVAQFTTATKSFDLTFPAVGNGYRLRAQIIYADTLRPNETYTITFNTNA
jgi:hypothetical protein